MFRRTELFYGNWRGITYPLKSQEAKDDIYALFLDMINAGLSVVRCFPLLVKRYIAQIIFCCQKNGGLSFLCRLTLAITKWLSLLGK
jgi:hypothetical protein